MSSECLKTPGAELPPPARRNKLTDLPITLLPIKRKQTFTVLHQSVALEGAGVPVECRFLITPMENSGTTDFADRSKEQPLQFDPWKLVQTEEGAFFQSSLII